MGRPKLIGPLTVSETKKKQQRHQSYLRNKQLTKDRALASKRRTQDEFKERKLKRANIGCEYCGYVGDPNEFDYHHRDPSTKITSVSDMVGRGSKQAIILEENKCDFICKGCHADLHYPHYPFHDR